MTPTVKVDNRVQTWAHRQEQKEAIEEKQAQALPADFSIENEMMQGAAKAQQTNIQDTLEDISLIMGSRLRDIRGRKADKAEEGRKDIQSVKQLAKGNASVELVELLESFGDDGESASDLLNMLRSGKLSSGMSMLLLGSMLNRKTLSPKARKILEDALSELLESEEEWAVSLFSSLSANELSSSALSSIKSIYQRTYSESGGEQKSMAELFEEIKDWEDRQEKVRILLRALALDLAPSAESDLEIRVANTINQLRRLLQFLLIEDHAYYVGEITGLEGNRVLEEVLTILRQNWFYPEWFQQRISLLGMDKYAFTWLRRLEELMRLLPLGCYQDEEQRDQLSDVLTNLITSLDEDE